MGELAKALCSELAGARGPPSSSVLRLEAWHRPQESYSTDRREGSGLPRVGAVGMAEGLEAGLPECLVREYI